MKFNILLKKLFVAATLLLLCFVGKAQDDVQLSQFFANKLFYSPASIPGKDGMFRVSLTDKEQWLGYAGRPSYRLLNATQFFEAQKMGIGLTVYDYNANIEHVFNAKLSYAYHIQLQQESFISLGISVGMTHKGLRNIEAPSGSGEIINGANKERINLDMGFGVEFYNREITAGVSVSHLPIKISPNVSRLALHSYYYFSYDYEINEEWNLIPMAVLRNASNTTNFDISLRAYWDDKLMFGAACRMDAVALMVGGNFGKHISLSYAIDLNLGANRYRQPSHELTLSYRGFLYKSKNQGISRLR